jgi:hypothetical protein
MPLISLSFLDVYGPAQNEPASFAKRVGGGKKKKDLI